MSKIENAVKDLAIALDDLSVRAERNILASAEKAESFASATSQARTAQKHAGKAALELAGVIDNLKHLIAKAEAAEEEAKAADNEDT